MANFNFNKRLPLFNPQQMEAIAKVLGDTATGLSGSEIRRNLLQSKIDDVDPKNTKWIRIFNAFVTFQNKHQVGNHIIIFIKNAMSPSLHVANPDWFNRKRDELNLVLSFCGYELGLDGEIRNAQKASTIDESVNRASRMENILNQRNVHHDVLAFCSSEILSKNYFHAVLEAMKSITAKLRNLSGLDGDGATLVERALSLGKENRPTLAINALDSETRRGEQKGFVSLLVGLYGVVRNPLAHESKIEWDEMTEQDAADILTVISLIHRKLDNAKKLN